MKNRRITIVAFLLIAALTLGFGYAAVTNVLDIQGSVTVPVTDAEKEFNEDIYFVGVVNGTEVVTNVDASANLGYTANINTNNNDKAQFSVTGISNKDDSEIITFRIKNDSEHEATVSMKSKTNTDDTNFAFDYYFGTEGVQTATIAAGQTVDVTVSVKLIKQLTAAGAASFVLELNVTAGDVVNP